jgi:RHS repeat-associated protein
VQENHYDPWGLNLVGIEKQGNPDHKFQYNGKEKQSELGLNWADYGARMYDPQLGRWHAVDPMTETQEAWTPYHYVYNNPVLRTDPDGRCPDGNCPEITVAGMIANTVKDLAVSAANVTFMAVEAMHPMRVYSQGGSQRASRDENGTIQLGIRPLPTSTGEVLRNAGSDALDAVNVASTAVGGGAGGAGLLLAKTVGKTAVTNAVVQAAKTSSDAPIKVTEEVIAKALEGSSMKTLQKEVSLPAVQRYVDKLQGGSTAPPIKVADGVIVDGNHRYVAGRVYGTEPAQVPYMISPSQAERIMPIQQIIVSPLDWGNH